MYHWNFSFVPLILLILIYQTFIHLEQFSTLSCRLSLQSYYHFVKSHFVKTLGRLSLGLYFSIHTCVLCSTLSSCPRFAFTTQSRDSLVWRHVTLNTVLPGLFYLTSLHCLSLILDPSSIQREVHIENIHTQAALWNLLQLTSYHTSTSRTKMRFLWQSALPRKRVMEY